MRADVPSLPARRMSVIYSAAQFNRTPRELNNWEVPARERVKTPRARPKGYTTKFIVSDNGHLLPSSPRSMPMTTISKSRFPGHLPLGAGGLDGSHDN